MAKKIKVTTDPYKVGRRKGEPPQTQTFTDRDEAQKWALKRDVPLKNVSKPTPKKD